MWSQQACWNSSWPLWALRPGPSHPGAVPARVYPAIISFDEDHQAVRNQQVVQPVWQIDTPG